MKALKMLTMALLLAAGTSFALNAQNKKDAKTETAVYEVSLHCANCKARVEKNIPFEKGVKDVVIDLAAKTVTVKFDPSKNSREGLRKAIEKLGYTCTVKEPPKA